MAAANATNIPIYVMKKDGTNQMIGQIKQTKTSSNSRYNISNIVTTPIETVNNFNRFIIDFIKKDILHPPGANLATIQTFNVFFIEDIIGIIFHKIIMRKGNIYFVFQKSASSSRFLCYLVPYENHSSIALGAGLNYSIQQAKQDITAALPYLLDRLGKFTSIYSVFQPNSANRFNVNRNFGL